MPAYRLIFRGKGFADACDPNGRQIIDGFRATLVQTGATKECAITTARAELLKNAQVRHLINETHAIMQEENTWTIECEDAGRMLFWWLRPRHSGPRIDFHWTPPRDIDLSKFSFEAGHLSCTTDHCTEAMPSASDKPARE